MKTTITGHITGHHYAFMPEGEVIWGFTAYHNPNSAGPDLVHVFAHSFDVDVPESIDIISAQIAALNAEKIRALDAYQASVREINDRLSKLQALTYVEQPA